jgi:hypothetical protein
MHRVSEGLTPEPLPDPDLELALVVTHEGRGRATLEFEVSFSGNGIFTVLGGGDGRFQLVRQVASGGAVG